MSLSPGVIVIILIICLFLICALWWLRYYEKKLVVQQVGNTHRSYMSRMAMEVYHIHVHPRLATPPPTYSKAVKLPVPELIEYDNMKEIVLTIPENELSSPPSYNEAIILKNLCSTYPPGNSRESISDVKKDFQQNI